MTTPLPARVTRILTMIPYLDRHPGIRVREAAEYLGCDAATLMAAARAGEERAGCMECGGCMTGCRHNAKNTLPKNYLGLAEKAGAVVHPLTTVTAVRPRAGGGWEVDTVPTGAWSNKVRKRASLVCRASSTCRRWDSRSILSSPKPTSIAASSSSAISCAPKKAGSVA